jgi:GWxTD domain-containing protein
MPRMLKRALVLLVIGALAALPATAKKPKKQKKLSVEEATNFLLGLDYSHWLVGAAGRMASEEEQAAYLRLSDDAQAGAFIGEFWKKRDPDPEMFGNEVRRLFDERESAADKRYREGASVGRRTARGLVYVVYGEPDGIVFETSTKMGEPDLEVWQYTREAELGLDGRQPKLKYWFAQRDGKMVEHIPRASRRNTIKQ